MVFSDMDQPIIHAPDSSTLKQGENGSLHCEAMANSDVEYNWKKDGMFFSLFLMTFSLWNISYFTLNVYDKILTSAKL